VISQAAQAENSAAQSASNPYVVRAKTAVIGEYRHYMQKQVIITDHLLL
jgi:hypothetical protein